MNGPSSNKMCRFCGGLQLNQETGKCEKCGELATPQNYGYDITRRKDDSILVTELSSSIPIDIIPRVSEHAKKNVSKLTGVPYPVVTAEFARLKIQAEKEENKQKQEEIEKNATEKKQSLTPEQKILVQRLLNDPKILDYAVKVGAKTVIGEDNLVEQIFICIVSGQTRYPMSLIITGYSGSGKNKSIDAILPLFPPDWIYAFTVATPEAVKYIPESFSGTLIIYETGAVQGERGALGLRAVGEGQSIETIYPMRDEKTGKMTLGRSKTKAKNFIATDSGLAIQSDLVRRVYRASTNDSDDLTRRVCAKKLRDSGLPESLKNKLNLPNQLLPFIETDLQNALSTLDLGAEVIVCPPTGLLDLQKMAQKKEQRVAFRTLIDRILSFIKNLALLRQNNRYRLRVDTNSYVIANVEDLEDALRILAKSIAETILRTDRRQEEALEIMTAGPMDKNDLAQALDLSPVTAAKILKNLARNGYLKEITTTKPYSYEVVGGQNKPRKLVISEIISDYGAFYEKCLQNFLEHTLSSLTNGPNFVLSYPENRTAAPEIKIACNLAVPSENATDKPDTRFKAENPCKKPVFSENTNEKPVFCVAKIQSSSLCPCGKTVVEYGVTKQTGETISCCPQCYADLKLQFNSATWIEEGISTQGEPSA